MIGWVDGDEKAVLALVCIERQVAAMLAAANFTTSVTAGWILIIFLIISTFALATLQLGHFQPVGAY
ncbi:hypothetical protein [Collimonas sp. OK242]|uniref:hypothetical protein n=1 Tax=Collimonas sp. OK242 TaxID=1798195 RepID=UPI000B86CFD2|nr:hypothetical protein [Collimonas sp. OK242]